MDYRTAREALRERRFKMRWSIAKLATAAGVDRSTIYRIENTVDLPDHQPEWATMARLAEALGTTLEGLTTGERVSAPPAVQTRVQAEAAEVARLWPTLGEGVRQAILTLIRAAGPSPVDRRHRPSATPPPAAPPAAEETAPNTPRAARR